MRGFILLFLLIVAPFAVAAAGLFLWERRKMSRPPRLELEGLLEELGFRRHETYFAGREIHHPFRRGGDEVDCFSDGGSNDVAFRIQGRLTIVSHLSNPTIAALIRNHPEILRGEFQELIAAENANITQAKAKRAHDKPTDWIYVNGGRELTPVKVDGLDVWKHDWTSLPGDPVSVKDPLYGQDFRFAIYSITDGRRTVTFAAGEFSYGMWGFFQPRSNERGG